MSVTPVFVYLFCFVLFLLFLRPCSTTMWICQILTSLDVNFPTLTWPDKLKWSRKCFKAHEAIFSVNLSWRHRCEVVMSERCPNRFPPLCKNWSDFLEINNFNKNKTFQVDVWPVSYLNDSEIQDRGLKSKKFLEGEHAPGGPTRSLRLWLSF